MEIYKDKFKGKRALYVQGLNSNLKIKIGILLLHNKKVQISIKKILI